MADRCRGRLVSLWILLIAAAAQGAGAESGTVCAVLKQPREYLGQTFTFTGRFYYGVHGAYFLPAERCGGDLAIRAVGWVPPRIRGRDSRLFTAKGRIVIHQQTPERMIGKPAEVVAFSIEHLEEILEFLHPPT